MKLITGITVQERNCGVIDVLLKFYYATVPYIKSTIIR